MAKLIKPAKRQTRKQPPIRGDRGAGAGAAVTPFHPPGVPRTPHQFRPATVGIGSAPRPGKGKRR